MAYKQKKIAEIIEETTQMHIAQANHLKQIYACRFASSKTHN